jgi:putative nucleotidyltransferase with HDIG domain
MPEATVRDIAERISRIPPMPESVSHIMEISGSNKYFAPEFTAIIESDPGLTADILKVANSAYAAQSREISSVREAVTILGRNMVVSAALRTISSGFFDRKLFGYGEGSESLWKHSFATAVAAALAAEFSENGGGSERAFTAGIVHDIGKVLLSECMRSRKTSLREGSDAAGGAGSLAAEKESAGADHCEAGALLAERWNLPRAFVDAIRYHHEPSMADGACRKTVSAVHVGDTLALRIGISAGPEDLTSRPDRAAAAVLGISGSDIDPLTERTRQHYLARMAMYRWG